MTKKQKEAIKKLEKSASVDIQTKTAHSLYAHGFISINGFSKGKYAHLNCSLRQLVVCQKGATVSPFRGAVAPFC